MSLLRFFLLQTGELGSEYQRPILSVSEVDVG